MLKIQKASETLERSRRFSVAMLAEFWGCSDKHVLRLIRSGRLQGINMGAGRKPVYIITAEAVQRFESDNLVKK